MAKHTHADVDYSPYLQTFAPLLQQQSILFQSSPYHATPYENIEAALTIEIEKQKVAAREKKAAGSRSDDSESKLAELPSPWIPLPRDHKLISTIESDWRWSSVCLFFEHFLPLFPNSICHFKPELLIESFQCHSHEPDQHKWSDCSCQRPACQHLAELLTQVLLMINPIDPNSKKLAKNQLNVANYLPLLLETIEEQYFIPDQEGIRQTFDDMMNMYVDVCEEKKRLKSESLQSNSTSDSISSNDSGSNESKSLNHGLPMHPPIEKFGSTILAGHVHQLPGQVKLHLLHFLCEYALSVVPIIRDACNYSHSLLNAGNADPDPKRVSTIQPIADSVEAHVLNPFHSLGLSEPHGIDDDGAAYWCFVQMESDRVHLYKDSRTGGTEFVHPAAFTNKRKHQETLNGGHKKKQKLDATNDEHQSADEGEDDGSCGSSSSSVDSHLSPRFAFTLLAHDLQSIQDFVQIGLMTQKSPKSLTFLNRVQSNLLPQAVLIQKKFERLSRREKTQAAASARAAAMWSEPPVRSQRVRKAVNYKVRRENKQADEKRN